MMNDYCHLLRCSPGYGNISNEYDDSLMRAYLLSFQHRILLNLRTGQPWEEVLRDLGHALRLPGASRLFTYSGQEVGHFLAMCNSHV